MELSEDEVENFLMVWAIVVVSLSYCYIIGKFTQKGFTRLLLILPVIALNLALPLKLTSYALGGTSAFFIAWLTNFKVLLFAFGQGPLCSSHTISLPLFLALGCFPIRIQKDPPQKSSLNDQIESYPPSKNSGKSEINHDPHHKIENKSYPSSQKSKEKSLWNHLIKGVILAMIVMSFEYGDYINKIIQWLLYFLFMYLFLDLSLSLLAESVNLFSGFELEPPFNKPLLSSSLQDFWGRRWNIMVTRILRPSVYHPTLQISSKLIGREWATLPATLATFLVSGLMHDLIFYYLGRVRPTFQVTLYFLLHGVCLCVEMGIKKAVGGKWKVPRLISGPATLVFVLATGFWLFLPPLARTGLTISRPSEELALVIRFLGRLKQALTFQ